MQIGLPSGRDIYREFVRRIAAVLAFFFAFVAISASLHHHDGVAATVRATSIERTAVLFSSPVVIVATKSDTHSFSATDCALCNWMMTLSHPAKSVAPLLFMALSLVASLLLMVRLAALCTVPAPRRGLRAPPAFSHA